MSKDKRDDDILRALGKDLRARNIPDPVRREQSISLALDEFSKQQEAGSDRHFEPIGRVGSIIRQLSLPQGQMMAAGAAVVVLGLSLLLNSSPFGKQQGEEFSVASLEPVESYFFEQELASEESLFAETSESLIGQLSDSPSSIFSELSDSNITEGDFIKATNGRISFSGLAALEGSLL